MATPRLFSYVITHDDGFAPNPFHGFLTLACCKPVIRRVAKVGDYVCANASLARGAAPRLVYIMRVTEKLTFDEYFRDERFQIKKPIRDGSKIERLGDNIYFSDKHGGRHQIDDTPHHCEDGDMARDWRGQYVLVSDDFIYWGGKNQPPPPHLNRMYPETILHFRQGHSSSRFPNDFRQEVFDWFEKFPQRGMVGQPTHGQL